MALPLIAAGIAAKTVAKKLATRAAGGIVGAGSKSVNPVYRNTGSVKVVSAKPKSEFNINNVKNTNKYNTTKIKDIKSGYSAKEAASVRNWENTFVNTKKPTVKINSNPMRGK